MPDKLLTQLFRSEFSKMVAVIGRLLGLEHIDVAEDIAGDAFLVATEKWREEGIPPNPQGWLYTVARNKAYDHLRRQDVFRSKVAKSIGSHEAVETGVDLFTEPGVEDAQVRMLFAVCHPAITGEAQIGLALRVLCGLTTEEIAEAFLTTSDTISKRLYRAKAKLKDANISLDIPQGKALAARIANVLHIIYLLFNEGYHSATGNQLLRRDLCLEALRLGLLLTKNALTDTPEGNALVALMCFHASRFSARGTSGVVLYDDQDETNWDSELMRLGNYYLNMSARGNVVSAYHLEAGIARWHCQKEDTAEKWEGILQLYNQLLQVNYSSRAALNRTYALYKVAGRQAALGEALKLKLETDHFYHALLAELYMATNKDKAHTHLQIAIRLAKSAGDKDVLQQKLRVSKVK